MKTHLVLALLLVSSALVLVPTASADTCASAVLENQVCGAVYVVYCAEALAGARQTVQCEIGAVERILTLPILP